MPTPEADFRAEDGKTMERGLFGIAAAFVICFAQAHAAPVAPTDAVRTAFQSYDQGWRAFDVGRITNAFADDFEWTNEVGTRFDSKDKLRSFLIRLFREPGFRAGTPGALVIRSIHLLGPDIAVVESSEASDGQTDPTTGKILPTLHTNELSVMQLQGGKWLIVSDLTSDESHGV